MLFFDPACLKPYDDLTLETEPMGGSEASMVRVARGLGRMMVMQKDRRAPSIGPEPNATQHWPIDWGLIPADGPIVVSRGIHYALHIRRIGAKGRVFLWVHDLCDVELALTLQEFARERIELIAVSHWHRQHILDYNLACVGELAPRPVIHVIHNPIDDDLAPIPVQTDPDKLVFNSSPHKGLSEALELFQALRARHPKLHLHVANPGYHPTPTLDLPGVYVSGPMPHARLMAQTRDAFCLFYPNTVFPETFGLVYAEANATGVPALTHPLGAAPEVLDDPDQLVDCGEPGQIIARFEAWREGARPRVKGREELRLRNILAQWRALLS